mgnify:CR=1 FL=1
MKTKITQSAAKHSNTIVLAVSCCELQAILNYESPIAYNSGRDGWNFDLYEINGCHSIVTGYRGMDRSSTHKLNDYRELKTALKELENYCTSNDVKREDRKAKLIELLDYHLVM